MKISTDCNYLLLLNSKGNFVMVKTRSNGPEARDSVFCLSVLSEVPQVLLALPPIQECNETEFSNSQASMVEFTAALPYFLEGIPDGVFNSFQNAPSAGYYFMDILHKKRLSEVNKSLMKEETITKKISHQGRVLNKIIFYYLCLRFRFKNFLPKIGTSKYKHTNY